MQGNIMSLNLKVSLLNLLSGGNVSTKEEIEELTYLRNDPEIKHLFARIQPTKLDIADPSSHKCEVIIKGIPSHTECQHDGGAAAYYFTRDIMCTIVEVTDQFCLMVYTGNQLTHSWFNIKEGVTKLEELLTKLNEDQYVKEQHNK